MSTRRGNDRYTLINLAAFFVLIAGMHAAASLFVLLLLAIFIAIVCLPAMHFLVRHKVPPAAAVVLITAVLICASILLGVFTGTSIADFSRNLPEYQDRLQHQMQGLLHWFSEHGIQLSGQSILQQLDPSVAMGFAGKMLAGLGNALANTLLILLAVIFLLLEAVALPHKWAAMGEHAPKQAQFEQFLNSVNHYLAIKTWVSLATGTLVYISLLLVGVDYPLLWAVLAFLFNYVPSIGSVIAAVPAVLLALVQLGPQAALWTTLAYTAINLILGNLIEPRYMGRGVGLSTLVVFLSLIVWGWVLGPVGMLLSVPLTMILKLALESSPQTRWMAILIGPDIKTRSSNSDIMRQHHQKPADMNGD